MAATLQQYLGQFLVPSNTLLTIGGEPAVTVTTGYYYIAGYTGETTNQFCEALEAAIQAGTSHTTATVVFDASTCTVTITLDSSATLSFSNATLRDALGFSGDQTSATTHTSDLTCRYCWSPSRGLSGYPLNLNNFWQPSSMTAHGRSRDGSTWNVEGNELYEADCRYSFISNAEAIKPSSDNDWQNFQSFFEDVVHPGRPIRIYPDKTLNTSSSFLTGVIQSGEEMIGKLTNYVQRSVASYDGLWDIRVPLFKYLSSDPIVPTATGQSWNYFDTQLPVGVSEAIEFLFQFDGTADQLTDRTVNGHDLTKQGSGSTFNTPVDGFLGLGFDTLSTYTSAADSGLQVTGEMTLEAIALINDVSSTRRVGIGCHGGTPDGTAANNTLYQMAAQENNLAVEYFHEYSTGTNVEVVAAAIWPTGTVHYLAITRNAAGTEIKIYQDGVLIYTSGALTAPTSGTNGYIEVGGQEVAQILNGVIFSLRMTPEQFSDDQILESYERVRGLAI